MTRGGGIRVRHAWLPQGEARDVYLGWDDAGRLTEVRPGRETDGPSHDGTVVPGLINAHAHLELSHLAGAVAGGAGFLAWLDRLWAAGLQGPTATAQAAAHTAYALGTAWLSDVTNRGDTGPRLTAAGLHGVVHHELLGFDGPTLPTRIALAERLVDAAVERSAERGLSDHGPTPPFLVRPSPHALLSTPVGLLAACVDPRLPPATLHFAECEDEPEFLLTGTGKVAELLTRLGRDWSWWHPPQTSAAEHLARHGLLGPDLMLVHAIHTSEDDVARIAANRAPICLCPRSNRHIGGRLPDLARLVRHGVRIAVGTDSLASSPDLDLLAEVRELCAADLSLPVGTWMHAATGGGADVVGARGWGRLEVGTAPGVLWLADLGGIDALRHHLPADRRWLAEPRAPGGTP
jgi:cytosine/adenosine deaminase-related metal-dependent hydrolase